MGGVDETKTVTLNCRVTIKGFELGGEEEIYWIVENNHLGITSRAYGPGRYARHEDLPANFIKWYMAEVVKA